MGVTAEPGGLPTKCSPPFRVPCVPPGASLESCSKLLRRSFSLLRCSIWAALSWRLLRRSWSFSVKAAARANTGSSRPGFSWTALGGCCPGQTGQCSRSCGKLPLRAVRNRSLGQIAAASGLQGMKQIVRLLVLPFFKRQQRCGSGTASLQRALNYSRQERVPHVLQ